MVAESPPNGRTQRSGLRVALAGLLVVLALGALVGAFVYLDGMSLVNGLLRSDFVSGLVDMIPSRPAPTPAASGATSRTVEPTATASTLYVPAGAHRGDILESFAEQIESNEQVSDLVAGRFASFDIGGVKKDDGRANITVVATYAGGGKLKGTLGLRKFGDDWFFTSLRREGVDYDRDLLPDSAMVDYALINTITREQAEYQDVFSALVAGRYRRMEITGVKRGVGTCVVSAVLWGGKSVAARIEIICITKTLGGDPYWFITGCRKV